MSNWLTHPPAGAVSPEPGGAIQSRRVSLPKNDVSKSLFHDSLQNGTADIDTVPPPRSKTGLHTFGYVPRKVLVTECRAGNQLYNTMPGQWGTLCQRQGCRSPSYKQWNVNNNRKTWRCCCKSDPLTLLLSSGSLCTSLGLEVILSNQLTELKGRRAHLLMWSSNLFTVDLVCAAWRPFSPQGCVQEFDVVNAPRWPW